MARCTKLWEDRGKRVTVLIVVHYNRIIYSIYYTKQPIYNKLNIQQYYILNRSPFMYGKGHFD